MLKIHLLDFFGTSSILLASPFEKLSIMGEQRHLSEIIGYGLMKCDIKNPSEFVIFWDYVNPKNIFPISFGTTSYVDITTFHRAYISYF